MIQELFTAFSPWHPNLDEVHFLNEGKNSERGVNFKISSQNVSFFIGAASCRFTKEGANWADADQNIEIMQTALAAFHRVSGISFRKQHVVLSMHLLAHDRFF